MRVLCVAEKPSISKAITGILSGGQYTTVGTLRTKQRMLSDIFGEFSCSMKPKQTMSRIMNSITLKHALFLP